MDNDIDVVLEAKALAHAYRIHNEKDNAVPLDILYERYKRDAYRQARADFIKEKRK